MRRLLAAPLVFAAVAGLALVGDPGPAAAQPPAPIDETFPTADGVRLKGLFHKSPDGAKQGNAVVVLLYAPGPDRSMTKPGDWDGLAQTLNKEGFHVFRFDWRGHGKSTDIQDPAEFWKNPITGPWNNRHVKGAKARPVKNDLAVKADIDPRYFPAYVTDLAAARAYLDQKSDQGDLNSSSIYLVGAGDAATLGMLWLAAEWVRPAVHPTLANGVEYKAVPTNGIVVNTAAGRDVAGAIWLSGTRPTAVRADAVSGWAKANLQLRDNNHMLFVYGEKDPAAVRDAKFFYDEVLVGKGNRALAVKPLEQTFLSQIAGSKLSGVGFLESAAKELGVQDTIVKYLAARQKDRASVLKKPRGYVSPYYIDLGYFGLRP